MTRLLSFVAVTQCLAERLTRAKDLFCFIVSEGTVHEGEDTPVWLAAVTVGMQCYLHKSDREGRSPGPQPPTSSS